MGCRGQVKVINDCGSPIFLYTHWRADELPEIVAKALSKYPNRNDDGDYLARIIFDEMIGKNQGGETGFGICTEQHEDIECLVTVETNESTVVIKSMFGGEKENSVSFEDFNS